MRATASTTAVASSASSPRAATSPASPSSGSTPCSTAARRAPASPWPTTARSRSSRTWAWSRQVFNETDARRPDRPRTPSATCATPRPARPLAELAAAHAARAASTRSPWATTATSSTPPSCATSCVGQGVKFKRQHRHRGHHGAHRPARRGRPARARCARRSASIRGAFSAAVLSGKKVVGFRDPYGVRPLCLGDFEGNPVIAARRARLDIIGAELRARDRAGRDRHGRREHGQCAASASSCAGARPAHVHLRVHLLRPARLADVRPHAAPTAASRWAGTWPWRRRSRPTSSSPCPTPACSAAIGYAASIRHPVRRGAHQEPLRAPHLHPARRPAAPARHPHEAQPPPRRHRGQAAGRGRRLHRARQHHRQARRHAATRPAPARCTCASARRPSSSPASTASTWPRATS